MSITEELREWWVRKFPVMDRELHKEFAGIADRIDAEHEEAENRWIAKNGDMWFKGYGKCRAEMMEGGELITADLEANGWVKLPTDADGVPIHLGDELECIAPLCPGVPKVFKVDDMLYQGADNWHLRAYPATYDPNECRHHHTPTVEDLLMDLLSEAEHFHSLEEERDAISDYASRLRLAGDGE